MATDTETYDITGVARGEAWTAEFEVKAPSPVPGEPDVPDDLTGRLVTFVVRDATAQRARLVSSGVSQGGSMQVTPAQGLVVVTLLPEVTAAFTSADWGLWLDETEPDADAVVWGKFRTVKVAKSDA